MSDFDILKKLLKRDRSVRRFDQSRPIDHDTLVSLVDLTRYCASGRNLQPLRYRLVSDPSECEALFPALAWAGYYQDWDGPEPGQRPVAYIVQCLDTELTENLLCDDGLNLQAITLGATALGFNGCIIKSFNLAQVKETLSLDPKFKPIYVVALGYPDEEVVITEMKDGDYKYFRDYKDRQCVPKRNTGSLII